MNQILYVQEKRNSNSTVDTKKVVLFFAVSIIIFGVILLGQGIYNVYQTKTNESHNKQQTDGKDNTNEVVPSINLTKTDDNKVVVNIVSEIQISHIIYNWNNETSQTLQESGKTNIEEVIDIPTGENILYISVIDINGKETKSQETYVVEQEKPAIELTKVGNNIKINVTSKVDLSYVTYRWNLEAENKEDMYTYENKTKFEKNIEIIVGQNTLKIVAVDINGNSSEKSMDIKGIKKPKEPKVIVNGEYFELTSEADDYIQTVEYTFNGKKYIMNTDTFGETKTVKYKIKLVNGWNYLKIITTTKEGASNSSIWKYEYKTQ